MHVTSNAWIWINALLTIAIFSYLWRENPLYRFAEHLFVGISVGYLVVINYKEVLHPKLILPLLHGSFGAVIPAALSILLFFRFSGKLGWLSFWPIAFLIGFSGGYIIPAKIDSLLLKQIQATVNVSLAGPIPNVIGGLIILVGTLSCLLYFYFSIPHKGIIGKISKFGSMLLMISFGASFGFTVMARISLLIGRVLFLLRDWLGMVT